MVALRIRGVEGDIECVRETAGGGEVTVERVVVGEAMVIVSMVVSVTQIRNHTRARLLLTQGKPVSDQVKL